ncbi:hypothetical protein RUND412_000980 [Rhizina undulata]
MGSSYISGIGEWETKPREPRNLWDGVDQSRHNFTWIGFPTDSEAQALDVARGELLPSDVKAEGSYNWVKVAENESPRIIVPGYPTYWNPPNKDTGEPATINHDQGFHFIDQNDFQCPEAPLEPIFRAIFALQPEFDVRDLDIVTDRNNLMKLFKFVSAGVNEKPDGHVDHDDDNRSEASDTRPVGRALGENTVREWGRDWGRGWNRGRGAGPNSLSHQGSSNGPPSPRGSFNGPPSPRGRSNGSPSPRGDYRGPSSSRGGYDSPPPSPQYRGNHVGLGYIPRGTSRGRGGPRSRGRGRGRGGGQINALWRNSVTSRIDVDLIGDQVGSTMVMCRWEPESAELTQAFKGFGHQFLANFTEFAEAWKDGERKEKGRWKSTSHHRMVSYYLGGKKFLVRFHADVCIEDLKEFQKWREQNKEKEQNEEEARNDVKKERRRNDDKKEDLKDELDADSLANAIGKMHLKPKESVLKVTKLSTPIYPQSSIAGIKTGSSRSFQLLPRMIAQVFFAQVPWLKVGLHNGRGTFHTLKQISSRDEFSQWIDTHDIVLKKLMLLLRKIREVVGKIKGRRATIVFEEGRAERGIRVFMREERPLLPEDLLEKWK